ncbi:hypothetical protein CALCODRAFT_514805 [Calocera cornea HHB12733]|uniref:Uncharacterized protein n=1 Tax=Calocera cornea HHB12733 TaxID=1353952 RepID=A0A165J255_9BASI|nr:hypothetical protein CALCODRAFT_514805 [Calocera cornea HHB12733]
MPASVRPSPNPSTDTLSAAPPLTFGASAASSSRSSSRSVHTLRPVLRRPDADMDSDSSSAGSDISARLSAPPNVKIPLGDAVEGIRREVREMRSVLNGTASGRTTPKRRKKGTRSGTDVERSRGGGAFSALGARSADEKSLLQRELEEANDFMTHTPIDSPVIASSSSIMSDSSAGAYPYHWAGNPYPSTYTDIPPSPSPSLHFSTSSSFQSSSHTPHTSLASSVYPLSSSSTNNTGTNTYTYTYSGMSSPMSNGTYRPNSLAFSQLSQSRSMQYLPLSPSLSGSASVHSQSLASTTGEDDDVAYRLKLLVQNRYYLPSPHDKPSVRELGGLTVSASGGITNTTMSGKPRSPSGGLRGLFTPRARSNSSLNSSPQKSPSGTPPLPQHPNGIRSSRSQVFTRAAAGPAPAPPLAVPGTFPRRATSPAVPSPPTSRTPEPKGRVMVIKEKVPDLPRAAREARLREEERVRTHPGVMKRREREILEQSQEWEVDPTEEVDTAPAALKDPVAARVAKVPMIPPRAPTRPPPPPPTPQEEREDVGLGISAPAPAPEPENKAKSVRGESEWETEDSEYEPVQNQAPARQPMEVDPEEAAWRKALLHQAVGLSMVEAWPSRVIADETEDSSAWETEAPVPMPKPAAQTQQRRPLGQGMYGGSNVDLRTNRQRTPSNASAASSAKKSVRKVASQPSMVVGPPPRMPLPPLPIPPLPEVIRPVVPHSAPAVLLPPAEVMEKRPKPAESAADNVWTGLPYEPETSTRQSFDSISIYSGTDGEARKRDTIVALPSTTIPSSPPSRTVTSPMHERNASGATTSSMASSSMRQGGDDMAAHGSSLRSRGGSIAQSRPGSPRSIRMPSLPNSPNSAGSFKRKPAPLVLGGPELATFPIPRGPLHPALQKDGSILALPFVEDGGLEFPTQRMAMTPTSIGASIGHGYPSTAPHDMVQFPINRVASPAMSNFSMPGSVPRASSTFSHADAISLAPSSKYHSSGARTTPLDQYGFDRRRPITNTPVEPPRSASPSARSFFGRFRKDSNKKARLPGSTFDLLKHMPASQSTVSLAMTRPGGISSENVNLVSNQSGRSGSSDAGVSPIVPLAQNTPTAAWTRSQHSEDPAVRKLDGMLQQHVEAERERLRQIASGMSARAHAGPSTR